MVSPASFCSVNTVTCILLPAKRMSKTIEQNWRTQTELGVANELLDRSEIKQRFPRLRSDDIDAGLFGGQDGFIDPYVAVTSMRRKAVSLGVEYIQDRVVALEANASRVEKVILASGRTLAPESVVNVAGAWAPEILRDGGACRFLSSR